MSALPSALRQSAPSSGASPSTPERATRRIAVVRAVAALVWAAVLVAAVGDDVPTTATELPTLVAVLLTAYPLIDVVASLVGATTAAPTNAAVLRANAALSALAVVALGIATLGGDAGSALVAFGAWAFVSAPCSSASPCAAAAPASASCRWFSAARSRRSRA
jgi:hypothetical protein